MRFSLIFAATMLTIGCAKHSGSYEQVASTGTAEQSAGLQAEADAAWENRGDAAQLKLALDKYESALQADSTNRHAAVRLTRGWYWYGDIHESTRKPSSVHGTLQSSPAPAAWRSTRTSRS